jgi:prophage antirepressor-like protein
MEIQRRDFKFGDVVFPLRFVIVLGAAWFVARDVALNLQYTDSDQTVRKNVDDKYKKQYKEFTLNQTRLVDGSRDSIQGTTVFIDKSGFIQLIMKSRMPKAVELSSWLRGGDS